MPIKIPATLPAHDVLRREGVMVMSEETALRQDIRPLQIGLLNLMPKKVQTETQFAQVIGATPLQIELTLIRMSDHEPRNTSPAHLEAFYQPFREARERRFDGLIITGAPIEHLDFEAVGYWNELREVFDWTQTNVHSTMGVCWGGMAMLHHFHGVPKHMLPAKAFGCFRHRAIAPANALLQGFSDNFVVPVSRWTEVRFEDVELHPELKVLIHSEEVGPSRIEDRQHRAFYMFTHLEYDSTPHK
jgi:homoserine O-succinyltransferase